VLNEELREELVAGPFDEVVAVDGAAPALVFGERLAKESPRRRPLVVEPDCQLSLFWDRPVHNGTLASISGGERSTKEKEPMELLPVELRKTLPPLYSQESCPTPIVHVKLFTPDSSFTWYVTEGAEQEDGDWLLFGLVIGLEEEWGYSLLSEIASARGPLGLPVERDLWFKPGPIDQLLSRGRPSAAVKEGDVWDER
jgi:hypothetical protein